MSSIALVLLALATTLGGAACNSRFLGGGCIEDGEACSVSVGSARGLRGCCSRQCGPERMCLPVSDDAGPGDAGPDGAAHDADSSATVPGR